MSEYTIQDLVCIYSGEREDYKTKDLFKAWRCCDPLHTKGARDPNSLDVLRSSVLNDIVSDESIPLPIRIKVAEILYRYAIECKNSAAADILCEKAYRRGSREVTFVHLLINGYWGSYDEFKQDTDPSATYFFAMREYMKKKEGETDEQYKKRLKTPFSHPEGIRPSVAVIYHMSLCHLGVDWIKQLETEEKRCESVLEDQNASNTDKQKAAHYLFNIIYAMQTHPDVLNLLPETIRAREPKYYAYLAAFYGDTTIPAKYVYEGTPDGADLSVARKQAELQKDEDPFAAGYLYAMMQDLGIGGDKVKGDHFEALKDCVIDRITKAILEKAYEGHERISSIRSFPVTSYGILLTPLNK